MSIDHSHEELTAEQLPVEDPDQYALDFGAPEAEVTPAEATNELAAFEGTAAPEDASGLFAVPETDAEKTAAIPQEVTQAVAAAAEARPSSAAAAGEATAEETAYLANVLASPAPAKEAEAPVQAPATVPAEKKGFHPTRGQKIGASITAFALAAGAAGFALLNRGGSVEATGATPVATSPANSAPNEGSTLPAETNGSVTITSGAAPVAAEATSPSSPATEAVRGEIVAPVTTAPETITAIPETQHYLNEGNVNISEILPDDVTYQVPVNGSNGEVMMTVPEVRDPLTHTPLEVAESVFANIAAFQQCDNDLAAEKALIHFANVHSTTADGFRADREAIQSGVLRGNGVTWTVSFKDSKTSPATFEITGGTPAEPIISLKSGEVLEAYDMVPYDGSEPNSANLKGPYNDFGMPGPQGYHPYDTFMVKLVQGEDHILVGSVRTTA